VYLYEADNGALFLRLISCDDQFGYAGLEQASYDPTFGAQPHRGRFAIDALTLLDGRTPDFGITYGTVARLPNAVLNLLESHPTVSKVATVTHEGIFIHHGLGRNAKRYVGLPD
jgi:hypothetical protein